MPLVYDPCMGPEQPPYNPQDRVEFRPGESSDSVRQEREARERRSPVEIAEETYKELLAHRDTYSEQLRIDANGSFDELDRGDGQAPLMREANTPEELYRFAQEIERRNPDLQFSFEPDKEGRWLRYTVSKRKKK